LNETKSYVTGQYCKGTNSAYYSPDYYCSYNSPNISIPLVWATTMNCKNGVTYDVIGYVCVEVPPPRHQKEVYST